MAKHTRVYPDRTGEVASAPYTLVPARERRRRGGVGNRNRLFRT